MSSPVPRCLETGRAIPRGGGQDERVTPDRRLGAPGPFVIAPDVAGRFFGEFESLPASAQAMERCLSLAPSVGPRLMRALLELGLVWWDDTDAWHPTAMDLPDAAAVIPQELRYRCRFVPADFFSPGQSGMRAI